MSVKKTISIIVPVYNEKKNLEALFSEIYEAIKDLPFLYEIIAVDDGSSDGSDEVLKQLATQYDHVKIINFRRNFGQTAALSAGFDHAKGDIIIPLDSDLQNDPKDIANLITKIDEGYDVVSGWRKHRQDAAIKRNFVSRVANKIISIVSGVRLNDYGCTLKAYKKSALEGVKLYGEMHRFIPIYAHLIGAKVTEIPVNHRKRIHGESKYGMNRVYKTMLDLMVVTFIAKYLRKPIYLFGGIGLILLMISFVTALWAVYLKFTGLSFIRTPLPLFSAMTFILGIVCILMGIMSEMIIRTYFESQDKKAYTIKNIITSSDKS